MTFCVAPFQSVKSRLESRPSGLGLAEHIFVCVPAVPQLEYPGAIQTMYLRQDVPLEGSRKDGDVQFGAILQYSPDKLLIHPNLKWSGRRVVRAHLVRSCIHNGDRNGARLRE
jgi:hypothetical protein